MSEHTARDESLFNQIHDLAAACLEGDATAERFRQIQQLVCTDPEARRVYLEYLNDSISLRTIASASTKAEITAAEPSTVAMQNAASDRPAFAPLVSSSQTSGVLLGYFASGWPVAYLLAAVIFAIGLVIGAVVHVSPPMSTGLRSPDQPSVDSRRGAGEEGGRHSPSSSTVAHVTGMADCECEGSGFRLQDSGDADHQSKIINHKSFLHLGDRLSLRSGLLEITYNTGARVILQGPVTYEVESASGGYLSVGKLTARLEKRGEGRGEREESASHQSETLNRKSLSPVPCPLFSVRTPTVLVTDLGTEFGVEVDKSGATKSHVFRGSVRAQTTAAGGGARPESCVLHEGQSIRVNSQGSPDVTNGITANGDHVKPSDFVREIPKRTIKVLDLVDVVAGGNGFSGRRNAGIDPTRGELTKESPKYDKDFRLKGDARYHRVTQSLFVDGVFIPDGSHGAVKVDSGGHTALAGVNTSNETSGYVWAGGQVPMSVDFPRTFPTRVGEVDYASDGHGFIFLHANKGITFDLDAIRRENGDFTIRTFRAVLANLETITPTGDGPTVFADAWVLVDGQTRFRRRQITSCSGFFWVMIPLGKRDRFLTLVATDAGNGISNDWIMFGDPQLEMVTKQSERQ